MNAIFKNLIIQNYQNFKNSFDYSKKIFWDEQKKKLVHPGEYGTYRESLVKNWLKLIVPSKYGIDSGFIINSDGEISTQADIIIYDKHKTPNIENLENQKFFPIETVACVGEIKSNINSMNELNKHLIKLSEFKKIRESVKDPTIYQSYNNDSSIYSVDNNPMHNIFTFLICNKFDFNFRKENINYSEVVQKYKHNLVLSLNDGILNYSTPSNKTKNLFYPFAGNKNMNNNFTINKNDELHSTILLFTTSIHQAVNMTTLLEIDMAHYIYEKPYNKII